MTKASKVAIKGLAGAVALAGANGAYADIVSAILPPNFIPTSGATSPANQFQWDVDGNGTADFVLFYQQASTTGNWVAGIYGLGGVGTAAAVAYNGPYVVYTNRLTAGNTIGAGSGFAQDTGYVAAFASRFSGTFYGQFIGANSRGFVGFEFTGTDGLLHYGYLELQTSPFNSAGDPGGNRYFSAFYNTVAGADILAGQVPEPGTLGALAMGATALGAVAIRRRKAKQTV